MSTAPLVVVYLLNGCVDCRSAPSWLLPSTPSLPAEGSGCEGAIRRVALQHCLRLTGELGVRLQGHQQWLQAAELPSTVDSVLPWPQSC